MVVVVDSFEMDSFQQPADEMMLSNWMKMEESDATLLLLLLPLLLLLH